MVDKILIHFYFNRNERNKMDKDELIRELVEALTPLANIDAELLENKKPTGKFAFDPWTDDQIVFNIGKERTITAGDLRKARCILTKCKQSITP